MKTKLKERLINFKKISNKFSKVKAKISALKKKKKPLSRKISLDTYDTKFLKERLKEEEYKEKYLKIIKKVIYYLVIIFAFAVILTNYVITVYQISDSTMTPTYQNGDLLLVYKTKNVKQNDVVAFYYGNKILLKRVIAKEGNTVVIDNNGDVYVNGNKLKEDYIKNKEETFSNITYPLEVEGGKIFVLSDNRKDEVDSKNEEFGLINEEDIIGKVIIKF